MLLLFFVLRVFASPLLSQSSDVQHFLGYDDYHEQGAHPAPSFTQRQNELDEPNINEFQSCSVTMFRKTGYKFLDWAEPFTKSDFVQRRDNVANALYNEGLEAFVAETTIPLKYFANLTWSLSERPMLMIIQPTMDPLTKKIQANTTFLVAAFEAGRLGLIDDTALDTPLSMIIWQEHWDPYRTLLETHFDRAKTSAPKIMVEAEIRDFVSRGLAEAGLDVVGYGGDVEAVRQIKAKKEIEIMRAVNTGTVEAVRAMRKCMSSLAPLPLALSSLCEAPRMLPC